MHRLHYSVLYISMSAQAALFCSVYFNVCTGGIILFCIFQCLHRRHYSVLYISMSAQAALFCSVYFNVCTGGIILFCIFQCLHRLHYSVLYISMSAQAEHTIVLYISMSAQAALFCSVYFNVCTSWIAQELALDCLCTGCITLFCIFQCMHRLHCSVLYISMYAQAALFCSVYFNVCTGCIILFCIFQCLHRLHYSVLYISEQCPTQRLLAVPRLEQRICRQVSACETL